MCHCLAWQCVSIKPKLQHWLPASDALFVVRPESCATCYNIVLVTSILEIRESGRHQQHLLPLWHSNNTLSDTHTHTCNDQQHPFSIFLIDTNFSLNPAYSNQEIMIPYEIEKIPNGFVTSVFNLVNTSPKFNSSHFYALPVHWISAIQTARNKPRISAFILIMCRAFLAFCTPF